MAAAPENPLEEALARAQKDVLARPEFYERLMNETVLIVGHLIEGAGGARGGMNLAIIRHNGRDFHPIFSSATRMKEGLPGNVEYFMMPGRNFFRTTKGAHFILNPNTGLGKMIFANEIAYWIDPSARARRNLQKNPPEAIVTKPREEPRLLVEALRILFQNRRDVVAAYVLEVAFTDRHEPTHPLIVLDTQGDWTKITGEVSALAGAVVPDVIIDLLPYDTSDTSLISQLKDVAPFYRRAES